MRANRAVPDRTATERNVAEAEEPAQRRAGTARRAHREWTRSLERDDVFAREMLRSLEVAGVRVQRAAAALAGGALQIVTVCDEHALRRAIRLGKQSFHHASEKYRCRSTRSISARFVLSALDAASARREHRHREAESAGRF